MDYLLEAEKISSLLSKINKNIHREVAKHIEQYGLTVPQMFVLRSLFKKMGLSISEISKEIGLSNSTVSGIVDRLEKEGYVERQRDAKDRRVVYVGLTEKSRVLKGQIPVFRPDYFSNKLREIEPDKVSQLVDSLSILAEAFE